MKAEEGGVWEVAVVSEEEPLRLWTAASITLTSYNHRVVDELFSCVEKKQRRPGLSDSPKVISQSRKRWRERERETEGDIVSAES